MSHEIERFITELEMAYPNLAAGKTVKLDPAEPNVMLELMFNQLGHVEAEYEFRGHQVGFDPRLTGTFTTDQTFVPEIIAGFRSLLHPVAGG